MLLLRSVFPSFFPSSSYLLFSPALPFSFISFILSFLLSSCLLPFFFLFFLFYSFRLSLILSFFFYSCFLPPFLFLFYLFFPFIFLLVSCLTSLLFLLLVLPSFSICPSCFQNLRPNPKFWTSTCLWTFLRHTMNLSTQSIKVSFTDDDIYFFLYKVLRINCVFFLIHCKLSLAYKSLQEIFKVAKQ